VPSHRSVFPIHSRIQDLLKALSRRKPVTNPTTTSLVQCANGLMRLSDRLIAEAQVMALARREKPTTPGLGNSIHRMT
jgi:hypothetical protein